MLVTYKSKQTTASKQPHPPKKNVNAQTKRGNQYDALNSVQENGEPLSTRNKSDKGKAKPGPSQGSKGKSSAPINPALINPSQVRASPPHPVSQTVQPGVPSTQNPAHRGRGGTTQGKGKRFWTRYCYVGWSNWSPEYLSVWGLSCFA
nr:LINE-type retrotransposon LIb DNA [Ipomoea trifida]